MPNIPFIQQNRNTAIPTFRRTKQAFESTDSTTEKSRVKRRLDRRKKKDRRQKQIKVQIDRRQRGMCRRKSASAHTDHTNLSANIGKHINTRA